MLFRYSAETCHRNNSHDYVFVWRQNHVALFCLHNGGNVWCFLSRQCSVACGGADSKVISDTFHERQLPLMPLYCHCDCNCRFHYECDCNCYRHSTAIATVNVTATAVAAVTVTVRANVTATLMSLRL